MKPLGRKQEKHLADVVLADAEWQQFQDRIHHAGISALVSATRNRRRRVRLANLAAIASIAFIVAGVYVATIHPSAHSTVSAAAPAVLSDKSSLPYISEQEVTALFPPGTCVLAEVNGEQKLVILDAKIAEEGFLVSEANSAINQISRREMRE